MNRFFFLLVVFFLFFGCIDSSELSKKELDILKANVINSGDNYSYTRLVLYYENKSNYYELLPFSHVMAFKYKKGNGYLMVYKDLIKLSNNDIFDQRAIVKLSNENKKIILNYLENGAKLIKDGDCRYFLEKHYRFGIGVERNIIKADSIRNINKNL